MSSLPINSITGAGSGAAASVASALGSRTAPQATTKDAAATGDAAADSSSATGGATITSSDFLTLLVSELKNQDPTQPTDPNAYIQQLVGVNSLQQLISINQELSPVTTSTSVSGT
jgi:flagellar basal-body rod modification protein FlgD